MAVELVVLIVVGGCVTVGLIALAIAIARSARTSVEDMPTSDSMAELKTLFANRDGALAEKVSQLDTKLAGLQESITNREVSLNTQVADMGSQMRSISGLFTNDRARGNWGEISMVRIFESGGMIEGRDYDTQLTVNGRTPDAIVHIPGGCEVVIDAKFPQARYVDALETADPEERGRLLKLQARELESVAKDLVKKHYNDLSSGSYVIMYLPSQAVYEAAVAADPEVLSRLMDIKVMVAGPNALFAILLNIGSLMKEQRAIEQADEILNQAKELQGRMVTFIAHLERVGKSLSSTVAAFNGAVGSWIGSVAPQLTRVGELRGEPIEAEILPIDESIRELPQTQRHLQAANH
jgi:DNA recombination protein RmuC